MLDYLGSLGGPRINNNGIVAGTSYDVFPEAAAIWDEVNGLTLIGAGIDVENYGIEIDDSLQLFGRTSNYNTRAWRYDESGFIDIPLLSGQSVSNRPSAMNELGEVVGTDYNNKRCYQHPARF